MTPTHILVIDDEPFVRAALQRVLGSDSVSVSGAENALAGFDSLASAPADLVIIDVILPGMDGVAAIREIRRLYPKMSIIAISGGGNFGLGAYQPESISTSAYLAACTGAGADATLAKPFETAELRDLIGRLPPR